MRVLRNFVAGLAALSLTSVAHAQQPCSAPALPEDDAVLEVIKKLAAVDIALEAPSAGPRSVQVTASPASGATSAVTAAAEGASLFALALESGVLKTAEGQITIGTSLFGLQTLFNSKLWYEQAEYEKYEEARRFNFKLTLGGKGEKFDRDGDGDEDEPLEAKELTDIVNWEIQYRLTKSRDRREEYNWKRIEPAAKGNLTTANHALVAFLRALDLAPGGYDAKVRSRVTNACFTPQDQKNLLDFVTESGNVELLRPLAKAFVIADSGLAAALKAAAEEIDKKPLFSLAAGGIERKEEYGNDVLYFALRGDWPTKAGNIKVNAEWKRVDNDIAEKDPTTLIASIEGTKLIFKGSTPERDVEGSLAFSYAQYRDVPEVDDGTQAKASFKLELPLSKGVRLPLSVTWANHKSLLDDDDEVVGHFGFAFDLSKVLEGIKPKSST